MPIIFPLIQSFLVPGQPLIRKNALNDNLKKLLGASPFVLAKPQLRLWLTEQADSIRSMISRQMIILNIYHELLLKNKGK